MIDFAQIRKTVPLAAFVEYVGVPLREYGDCWRAKCPFHKERRGASLVIYPDRHWFCHGRCHTGGDVVRFAQLIWELESPAQAAEALLGNAVPQSSYRIEPSPHRWEPKWPQRDLTFLDSVVQDVNACNLTTLFERSPLKFPTNEQRSYVEETVDIILPEDPLLCIAKKECVFGTRRRSVWHGHLERFPLMVPSPMMSVWGKTQEGVLSQHAKAAVARRVYLVIEFDFALYEHDGVRRTIFADLIERWQSESISVADACAALLWHLQALPSAPPFVMAVHSGGKSLHGWFYVLEWSDEQIWPFMRYAYQLGADHVTWSRSQFVRIPEGRRQNGALQKLYYLDPASAVQINPSANERKRQ